MSKGLKISPGSHLGEAMGKKVGAIMMFGMGCHQWSRQITLLGLSKEVRESPSVESPGKLVR
jgi:hypothetical protein